MNRPVGRSVKLFLVDGSPTGVVTAEIINWTGHALLAPRSDLSVVRKRQELQRTGVYLLLGEVATTSERRRVYVGESDDVGRRIEQHASSRSDDFFERFCIFTNKDSNLTKAHARYLESRLTSIAKESGRAEVLNGNVPPTGVLAESDIADMEYFIEQIELVLPVLGFDILKKTRGRPTKTGGIDGDTLAKMHPPGRSGPNIEKIDLILTDQRTGVVARAILDEAEYVVLEGSTARSTPQASLEQHLSSYFALRESLISDGALVSVVDQPALLRFSRDVVFRSPSAASAVILGRSDNGRRTWKVSPTGETLADYQERQLKEAAE